MRLRLSERPVKGRFVFLESGFNSCTSGERRVNHSMLENNGPPSAKSHHGSLHISPIHTGLLHDPAPLRTVAVFFLVELDQNNHSPLFISQRFQVFLHI